MEMSIFKPPAVNQVSHLASNVPYWSRQYHVMYKASVEHSKATQKVIDDNNANIEIIEARGASNADEMRFLENMKTLQVILSKKMEDLNKEAEYMDGLEKDLKEMSINKKKDVEKTYKKYQNSRDKLTKKTVQVDAGKKAYHKTEFQIERLEIKQADEKFIGSVTKQLDVLKKKTTVELETYERKVVKWEAACKKAVEFAEDYQFLYSKMEAEKADVVIGSLAQWAELLQETDTHQSGDNGKTKAEDIFKDINSARVIEKAVSTTETVKQQEIEIYERTEGKSELRKAVLADGLQTEDRRVTKNGALYKVLSPNATKDAKQLKLKGGEFVKQILSVNTQGLIYCKIEHRLPFRRKKGFLPLTCICPGVVDDSSANNNTSDVHITSTNESSSNQTSDDDQQSVADVDINEKSANRYEDALNPFGDNDDDDADDVRDNELVAAASVDSLNPFKDENDDDPDDTREASENESYASVASLNPFGDDDDDDGDDSFNVRENEAVGNASVDTLNPYEAVDDASVDTLNPYEAVGDASVDTLNPYEAVGDASVDTLNPYEAVDDASVDTLNPYEAVGDASVDTLNPYEAVDDASVDTLNPYEAVGDARVDTLNSFTDQNDDDGGACAKESEMADNASVESLNPFGAEDDGVDDAISDVGETYMVVDTYDDTFDPFADDSDDYIKDEDYRR